MRTNNKLEGYHCRIQSLITRCPGFYEVVGLMHEEFNMIKHYRAMIDAGTMVERGPNPKQKRRDSRLRQLWDEYINRDITTWQELWRKLSFLE